MRCLGGNREAESISRFGLTNIVLDTSTDTPHAPQCMNSSPLSRNVTASHIGGRYATIGIWVCVGRLSVRFPSFGFEITEIMSNSPFDSVSLRDTRRGHSRHGTAGRSKTGHAHYDHLQPPVLKQWRTPPPLSIVLERVVLPHHSEIKVATHHQVKSGHVP